MTPEQWRSSAPWRAGATCTVGDASTTVCTAPDQPLGKTFRARNLTSTFHNGRLTVISYTSSIDGFAAAVAELRHAYGNPDRITHDRVLLQRGIVRQRVIMLWANVGATIRLVDPVANGGQLQVTFALDDMAAS